jgi:ABC-type Na+ efflux pump permease subunit
MLNGPLRFHRAAEARGYPALLLVAMVCLTAVVAAIALIALIPTWFALAFAMLILLAAFGVLAAAVSAAFSDTEDPEDGAGEPASIRDRPAGARAFGSSLLPRRRARGGVAAWSR